MLCSTQCSQFVDGIFLLNMERDALKAEEEFQMNKPGDVEVGSISAGLCFGLIIQFFFFRYNLESLIHTSINKLMNTLDLVT